MQKIIINKKDILEYREGSGGTIEIYNIAVYSGRCKGNGRKLIELLKERVKTNLIFAITREDNKIGHIFYEKVGFRLIAKMPKFYKFDKEIIDARMYGIDL